MRHRASSAAWTCIVLLSCGLVAGVSWWRRTLNDPSVIFLQTVGDADWLRPDRPFNGEPQPGLADVRTDYRARFDCETAITGAVLRFRALRTAEVRLDGETLAPFAPAEDWDRWQEVRTVVLPPLGRGSHQLEIAVLNRNGPALLQAWSDELGLSTGREWEARLSEDGWSPAKSVHEPWIPSTARQAPSLIKALRSQGLGLAALFGFWLAAVSWIGRGALGGWSNASPGVHASRVRWGVIGLWFVLALNNEFKLTFHGFDATAHSDYIKFILEHHRIPLAGDGWQMFQAPLYHMVAAAIYGPIKALLRESYGWHAVRLMTLACGILQVEVCYRAVRRVFPGRDDVQIMGVLVGGLMPMNVYMSHLLGNEPLAGLLSATAFLIGLGFLDGQFVNGQKWPIALGVTWGLAMLAKVTPLLLGIPLLVMCLRGMIAHRVPTPRIIRAAALVLGGAFLVCGWYYVRNWVLIGRPFIGGWDPVRGIAWWQDPGYRVSEHLLGFGESLQYPIWAGYAGLWDGLYSTMWLDGYLSATIWTSRPPWNGMLLICSAALALVPLATMFAGALSVTVAQPSQRRWSLAVCLLAIGVYLAAISHLYLRLPIYSTAKGTYLLGLLPCFAILTAAGFDAVRSYALPRLFLQAALLTWATCVYAAYFIV